jgi:hypothetical protein
LTKKYGVIGLALFGFGFMAVSSLAKASSLALVSAPKASRPGSTTTTLVGPQSQVAGATEVAHDGQAATVPPGTSQTFRDGDTTTTVMTSVDGETHTTKTETTSGNQSSNTSVNISVTSNSSATNSGSHQTQTGSYSNSQVWSSGSNTTSNYGNSHVQIVH